MAGFDPTALVALLRNPAFQVAGQMAGNIGMAAGKEYNNPFATAMGASLTGLLTAQNYRDMLDSLGKAGGKLTFDGGTGETTIKVPHAINASASTGTLAPTGGTPAMRRAAVQQGVQPPQPPQPIQPSQLGTMAQPQGAQFNPFWLAPRRS